MDFDAGLVEFDLDAASDSDIGDSDGEVGSEASGDAGWQHEESTFAIGQAERCSASVAENEFDVGDGEQDSIGAVEQRGLLEGEVTTKRLAAD